MTWEDFKYGSLGEGHALYLLKEICQWGNATS